MPSPSYQQSSRPPRNLANSDGYTLVELMVAIVTLTLLTFGVLSGMLQSRRLTEGSIHLGTAATVAQGYTYRRVDFTELSRNEYEAALQNLPWGN